MANCVLVWDAEGLPPAGDWTAVLWRGFCERDTRQTVSIPELVEDNADALKARYLAWIYELGETRIKGRRLVDHLELRPGFSYWWMTLIAEKCNYAKSPQIDDAIRLMAFDDWATDRTVSRIILVSAKQPLAECMRLWCARLGVVFEWQCTATVGVQRSFLKRAYHALPSFFQALTWLVVYLVSRWPLKGVGLSGWHQSEGRVTFISYSDNFTPDAAKEGRYESRYWAHLPDDLRCQACKTNWLHLYVKDSLLPTASKAADIMRQFNSTGQGEQCHVTLDSFLSVKIVINALRDWFRLVWRGQRLRSPLFSGQAEGIDIRPLFKNDWTISMSGLTAISNILFLNLFESALKSLPKQHAGVYLQENLDWEFPLISLWKATGHGCLIGTPHATVPYWDLRYFFDPRSYSSAAPNDLPRPDKVAINGSAAREAYLAGHYPEMELIEVEALRYLHLAASRSDAKPVLQAPASPLRVLAMGDYLPSNTKMQMRLLEEAMQYLPADTVITVKPHPNCPVQSADYPGIRMTVTMDPIAKLLAICDVAYASNATSAAVDAYCAGVPVVAMLDPRKLNLSPLRGCERALFVSTPKELASALLSAELEPCSLEKEQGFFVLDPKLPRWKKLLLAASHS